MSRILYCHTALPGGAELAAPAFAKAIDAELWIRGEGQVASSARASGLTVSVLSDSKSSRPRSILQWVRSAAGLLLLQFMMFTKMLACRQTTEWFIVNSVQGLLHTAIPAMLLRIPLVVYVRDLGQGGDRPAREVLLYKTLIRLSARQVIFNSALTEHSWNLSKSSLIVRTAVPARYFDLDSARVLADPRTAPIVMVGRISHWKGQREVIAALDALTQRGIFQGELIIVGGALFGEDVNMPETKFSLTLTGHVTDPEKYMRRARLIIHASTKPEPLGQVVGQAAALGVPILCSSFGGQLEWLSATESCLTADPRRPEELQAALAFALTNPDEMTRRAERARRDVRQLHEEVAYERVHEWLRK